MGCGVKGGGHHCSWKVVLVGSHSSGVGPQEVLQEEQGQEAVQGMLGARWRGAEWGLRLG